jgi:hypothetical protein
LGLVAEVACHPANEGGDVGGVGHGRAGSGCALD